MYALALYLSLFTLVCVSSAAVLTVASTTLYVEPYTLYAFSDNVVSFEWNATGEYQSFYVTSIGMTLESAYFNCTADEIRQTCNMYGNYTTEYATEAVNSMVYDVGSLSSSVNTFIAVNDGEGAVRLDILITSNGASSNGSILIVSTVLLWTVCSIMSLVLM